MRIIHTLLISVILFDVVYSGQEEKEEFSCSDFKTLFVGNLLGTFHNLTSSFEPKNTTETTFFLVSNTNSDPTEVNVTNWSGLESSSFDSSKKTYIIIHGYQTNYQKPWVVKLKNKLIEVRNVNIILVDWSLGSYLWNYIDSVKITLLVRRNIFNFLQELKTAVKNLNSQANEVKWNHLYFIGHSLGAHISGQVAHLLKQDNFYKVERITGLDPAKPCFTKASLNVKLDKEDADFVDAIHTQTGKSDSTDAFGLRDPVGHIDFYVNGGVMQPACFNIFYPELSQMICSHNLVYDYFIESVRDSENDECKFLGYKWNRSYEDALQILNTKKESNDCSNCPEMGLNTLKSNGEGTFMVITAATTPYCEFNTLVEIDSIFKLGSDDDSKVKKSIELLKIETVNPSTRSSLPSWLNFNFTNIFDGK